MAICPRCRSEYRAEFTRCATCDVDLVDPATLTPELSEDEVLEALAGEEHLITVSRGTVEWCKEVQYKLMVQRIPALVRRTHDAVATAGHHLVLEVCIREADAERASAVFDQELLEKLVHDGLIGEFAQLHAAEAPGEQGGGEAPAEAPVEDDRPPPCPACGSRKGLKKGKCKKCGLFLGEE